VAEPREPELTRRELLRRAGGAAAFAVAGPHRFTRRSLKHELRILQWAHPTAGYDAWLDREYTARWGRRNDALVVIDHVNLGELAPRARAELATSTGHDLVQLRSAPTGLQLDAAPLNDAVAEVRRTLGSPAPAAAASAFNPRTKRWFAFPDHYVPLPIVFRVDLWEREPESWASILAAAPALRRRRHGVAIGLAGELDSNAANVSMLLAHGGRIQDRDARPALATDATRAYLHTIAGLYRRGMPREVVEWTPASNNQYLFAGRASLVVNPATAVADADRVRLPLARDLQLGRPPAGPAARVAVPHTVGCYVLWRFSQNRELAERYLVDQQLAYREHFVRSGFTNVPAWTGAVPGGFDGMRRLSGGRFGAVVDTAARTVAAGSPGPTNGAVQELLDGFLVATMARRVAQGQATVEDALADAHAQAREVFDRWREARLI